MIFAIKNRWIGNTICEAEIDDATPESRRAAEVLRKLAMCRADLTRADLTRADLTGANLAGANLADADLTGANLADADLADADLTGANLADADLTGADLADADLADADLADADLTGARNDLWDVLLRAQPEIPALHAALIAGRVDGSIYRGDCGMGCLIGSIEIARGCGAGEAIPRDSSRPIERWFLAIKPGDTTETSQIVKITAEWIAEFAALVGVKL